MLTFWTIFFSTIIIKLLIDRINHWKNAFHFQVEENNRLRGEIAFSKDYDKETNMFI